MMRTARRASEVKIHQITLSKILIPHRRFRGMKSDFPWLLDSFLR